MRSLLTNTIERVGPTPRNPVSGVALPLSDRLRVEPALVRWAGLRDGVWRDGEVRWGCAIAPPRALSGHDHDDHAMLVVVADEVGASPELLHVVALRIGDLLRQGVPDPRLDAFESVLQLGVQGLTVPAELGGTLPCRVFTVVAQRAVLPSGKLVQHLFPVLARASDDPAVMILPKRYWDPRWRDAWESGFTTHRPPRRGHARRRAFAKRLHGRSFGAYRLLMGALSLVPSAVILAPVVLGIALLGLFGAFAVAHAVPLAIASLVAGLCLCIGGVTGAVVLGRRTGPVGGTGLGGDVLPTTEATGLWALVREVEAALDVIPVDAIVLDRSFDVRVHDRTRAMPFAQRHSVLVIGLPLMLSVSPNHLRGLLFHALCEGRTGWHGIRRHLGRHQSWVHGWTARQSVSTLDRTIGRALRAYRDLFEDLGQPMARAAVMHADKVAAGHVSAEVFGDAIIRAHVLQGWWQTRWDEATFRGDDVSGPVPRPLARWRARGPELNATMARLALTASVRRSHAGGSGELSPGDRVRALGIRARLVGDPPSLAATLLGSATLRVIDHVDDLYAVHFGEVWRRSRHAAMRAHRRRDALARLAPSRRSLFQHLELVELCRKLEEPFLAAQHGIEAASFFPRQAGAQLTAGIALLDIGDEQGLARLRQALELDAGVAPKACAAAMAFLQSRNMHAEMEAWGELWGQSRGSLSVETVRETPAIVVQALAATSSG